ncbi:hypothetical protein I6E52_04675 [Salinibacterium sp. NG253]|nr:hypothetical protein [Salinibacterium sp. NG253]
MGTVSRRNVILDSIAVDRTTGDVPSPRDGILQRVNDQLRLHPGVDRVADDPVREHAFDREETAA